MGRGLSQQQKDILEVLPDFSEELECGDAPTRREVVGLIDLDLTHSNRTSVSRAITRLIQRGLVLNVWGFDYGRQRTGYARATPEQVEARDLAIVDLVSRTSTRVDK